MRIDFGKFRGILGKKLAALVLGFFLILLLVFISGSREVSGEAEGTPFQGMMVGDGSAEQGAEEMEQETEAISGEPPERAVHGGVIGGPVQIPKRWHGRKMEVVRKRRKVALGDLGRMGRRGGKIVAKKGEKVFFKNEGNQIYELRFPRDKKRAELQPGQSYLLKFVRKGSYRYVVKKGGRSPVQGIVVVR